MSYFVNRNCSKFDLLEASAQNLVFGTRAENNFVKIKHLEIAVLGFARRTYVQAPKITATAKKATWSCFMRKSTEKLVTDNIIS